jgi:hypothetical protein
LNFLLSFVVVDLAATHACCHWLPFSTQGACQQEKPAFSGEFQNPSAQSLRNPPRLRTDCAVALEAGFSGAFL